MSQTGGDTTDSQRLFAGVANGDEAAAEELFAVYVQRLIGLAQARISERLRQKVDADDIVLSAMRSFFIRAREGQFVIERSGELWALLAAMTRNKLLRRCEHFRQQKRDVARDAGPLTESIGAVEPTVEEALAVADELELVMGELTPLSREIAERRLQGQSIPDIAEAVDRSERTVRRLLATFRTKLEERLRAVESLPTDR